MRHWLRSHLTYANVMVTILAFIVLGGTTYAATGDFLKLGNPNSANAPTSLTASPSFAGKALQVTNTSTGAGATALGLSVGSGRPPFTVNSGTKVANLNADKLDGIDSTGLGEGVLGGAATNVSQSSDETRPLIGTSSSSGSADFVAPTTFVVRNFAAKLDSNLPALQNGIDGLYLKVNGTTVCYIDGQTDHCESGGPATVPAGSLYSLTTHPVNVFGSVPTLHFGWRATP